MRELHSWVKPAGFRSRASAREGEVVMMGLGSGLGVGVYLICSYILCPWAVVVLKALDFARRLLFADGQFLIWELIAASSRHCTPPIF